MLSCFVCEITYKVDLKTKNPVKEAHPLRQCPGCHALLLQSFQSDTLLPAYPPNIPICNNQLLLAHLLPFPKSHFQKKIIKVGTNPLSFCLCGY